MSAATRVFRYSEAAAAYAAHLKEKGWFDRVFVNGLMYGQLGRFNHGGLKGKKAMVSMTTGCFPGMVDSGGVMGHLDAVLWQLQYGTLAYVGFDVHRLKPGQSAGGAEDGRLSATQPLDEDPAERRRRGTAHAVVGRGACHDPTLDHCGADHPNCWA